MYDEAIAWAQAALASPIRDVRELPGGMTSAMLALTDASGRDTVLRLMTNEPWRTHGAELTRREQSAQRELERTRVPAPTSLALDPTGESTKFPAHLMSRLPGLPGVRVDSASLTAMATTLAIIHDVQPSEPFREYQSWAWEAKWVVPEWSANPGAWRRAFAVLAEDPPDYTPTFLHRDFSHRNLLWDERSVCGVVDWVETSIGPAWLDAAHGATNLAVFVGPEPARAFLAAYGALTGGRPDRYWLIMDAVGFLPPPGTSPMFGDPTHLARLDAWVGDLVGAGLG